MQGQPQLSLARQLHLLIISQLENYQRYTTIKMAEICIRSGTKDDCTAVAAFIKGLGDFLCDLRGIPLKTPDVQELQRDGFQEDPWFKTILAEITDATGVKKAVGVVLYCHSYSMFRGRTMHIESIFIDPAYRNKGIGLLLMKEVAKKAIAAVCTCLELTVLESNTDAIRFYERHGLKDEYKELDIHIITLRARAPELKKLTC